MKQFYYLSPIQKLDIVVVLILFLFLFGFFRTIILNKEYNTNHIIGITILFALWYTLTKLFTNVVMFQNIYTKLNPYEHV